MIILKKNFRHKKVSLKITSPDDLWYLSELIDTEDIVTSKTERKIKIGDSSKENVRIVRKTVTLSLSIKDISLSEYGDVLRLKGTVLTGMDDIPSGSYHSLNIAIDSTLTLQKTAWPSFLRDRLDEAVNNSGQSVLFVLFDREKALFSHVRQSGIYHLSEQKTGFSGKQYSSPDVSSLYDEIVKTASDYVASKEPSALVVASPDFWKPYLKKAFDKASFKQKPVFVTLSTVDKSMVTRLLSRPELSSILQSQRISQEQSFADTALEYLNKNQLAYGFDEVLQSAQSGAISHLGVTDTFIYSSRQKGTYSSLRNLLSLVDASRGKITVIKSSAVKKVVDGLGGVVGVLRWKTQ
ncbi:MAG: hypothetical protein ACQESC_00930 [Nanobdellota archaeon]